MFGNSHLVLSQKLHETKLPSNLFHKFVSFIYNMALCWWLSDINIIFV